MPHVGGFDEPLAAVYRTALLPQVESLLAIGLRRPALMFDRVRTRRITPEEFADVDPDLHSLANVNSPADYRNALQKAGLAAAPEDSS